MARTTQIRRLLPLESSGTRATYRRPQVIPSPSTYKAFKKVAPEIWREILEYFDPEVQRADLVSCSLACRELVHPSQCVLFEKLTLESGHDLDPILHKLTNSPRFAQNIRHLHVNDFQNGQEWSGSTNVDALLALCTGVVKLSVRSQSKRSRPGLTSSINTRICETALLFRSLSSVHTIDIAEKNNHQDTAITEFLNGFPQLRTLVVSTLTRENRPLSQTYEGHPQFSLQSLVLNLCVDIPFLKWLSPACKNLTHLKLARDTALSNDWTEIAEDDDDGREAFEQVGYNCREGFKQWMHDVGENVTHLNLDWTTSDIHGQDPFLSLLQFTPRIESLTILGLSMDSQPLFKKALDLLGTSKLTCLKELTLGCDIPTDDDPEFLANESDWPYIQTALMGADSTFSNVRLTINLDFITKENVTDVPEDFQDMYHTLEEKLVSDLPLFSSRNMLHTSRCLRNGAYEWIL